MCEYRNSTRPKSTSTSQRFLNPTITTALLRRLATAGTMVSAFKYTVFSNEEHSKYATSFSSTQHSLTSFVANLLISFVIISLILIVVIQLIPLVTTRATLTIIVSLFCCFQPKNMTSPYFMTLILFAETPKPY